MIWSAKYSNNCRGIHQQLVKVLSFFKDLLRCVMFILLKTLLFIFYQVMLYGNNNRTANQPYNVKIILGGFAGSFGIYGKGAKQIPVFANQRCRPAGAKSCFG